MQWGQVEINKASNETKPLVFYPTQFTIQQLLVQKFQKILKSNCGK